MQRDRPEIGPGTAALRSAWRDTGDVIAIPRLNGQARLSSSLRRTPAECVRMPGVRRSNSIRSTRNRTRHPGRPGCGRGGVFRTESTSPTLVQRACRGSAPRRGSRVTGCCHRTVGSATDSSCGRTRRPRGRPGYLPVLTLQAAFRPRVGGVHPIQPSRDHRVAAAHPHLARGLYSVPARAERQPCGDWEQSTCERSSRE